MIAYSIPRRAMWRAVGIVVALALIAAATVAYAMRVSPMVLELESRGTQAVGRIEVQNLNPGRLAFETRVTRLEYDENGNTRETPADQDFLIFPPQGVLPTGGRQVIRVQWVGNADLAASQAYYVAVTQLPVPLDEIQQGQVGAQVQVVYNMKALVVVAPPGAQPNVSAASVRAGMIQLPTPPGASAPPAPVPGVEITLRNEGRRHAMMAGVGWRLAGRDPQGQAIRVDITPDELNRTIGTGYVPALGQRTFRVPLNAAFGPQPIQVSFIRQNG